MFESVLLVMRLADMAVTHPEQDNSRVCSACGEVVGIYPDGQAALRNFRGVKILCTRCQPISYQDSPAQIVLDFRDE